MSKNVDWQAAEQRILCGMKEIQSQMVAAKDGQAYKVTFRGNAIELVLDTENTVALFPPSDVVRDVMT